MRKTKVVRVDNGDFLNANTLSIVLGDFIPFYFGVRMPMLYVMQHGGNFVARATPAEEIVYIVCALDQVVRSGQTYYFSDGHATDSLTTFYDKSMIGKLTTLIDWNAITTQYWGGQDNLNIKRKKQAEFLLGSDVAPTFIVGFGCYNIAAKQKLQKMGIGAGIIKVIPQAYY